MNHILVVLFILFVIVYLLKTSGKISIDSPSSFDGKSNDTCSSPSIEKAADDISFFAFDKINGVGVQKDSMGKYIHITLEKPLTRKPPSNYAGHRLKYQVIGIIRPL